MSLPKYKIEKTYFFPSYPVDLKDEDDVHSHDEEYDAYYRSLNCGKPSYCESAIEKISKSSKIEIGTSFDIISILSTFSLVCGKDKRQPSTDCLRGKYILVCCFYVPILFDDWYYFTAESISAVCSELYSDRDDFELVVVAKMKTDYANDDCAFRDFLSGFPSSCLAVDPVPDPTGIDYICKLLGLDTHEPTYVLVDDTNHCQKVLQHSGNLDVEFFECYGADAFPFTALSSADAARCWRRKTMIPPCQLEELLGLNPSDFLFKNKHSGVEGNGLLDKVSVSLLKERVVALQICCRGIIFRQLEEVYNECRNEGKHFEAVLVYCPFRYPGGPREFIKVINSELTRWDMPWWILPYKDSVSRRLWRMCGESSNDKVIIVGPSDEFLDPCGGRVMDGNCFGMLDASPSTRVHLIKSEVKNLKNVTLESVLVYNERNYVLDLKNGNQRRVPVDGLRDKYVLVYFSMVPSMSQSLPLYNQLAEWCSKIKDVNPLFEVVFVGLSRFELDEVSSMPWLVCPFNKEHAVTVFARLPSRSESIFAFCGSGRIISIRAQDYLGFQEPGPLAFFGDLHLEVISALIHRYNLSLLPPKIVYEEGASG